MLVKLLFHQSTEILSKKAGIQGLPAGILSDLLIHS
jgi:hypothetical protein